MRRFCCRANRRDPEQFLAAQAVASAYRHLMRGSDREREPVRRGCGGCGAWRRAARAERKDTLPSIVPGLAAVLPQLDRSRCAPGTRRETIFSGFARLGGL